MAQDFMNPNLLKSAIFPSSPLPPRPMDEIPHPNADDDGAPDKDTIAQADEITKLVSKLYTPGHEILDKFNEVWSQMPQREKPSVLRKVVASMVAAGPSGAKGADEVINQPYNQAMSDWETKLKFLQPALGEERYSNANERYLATSAASQVTANRRIAESERAARAREEENQRHNRETEALNVNKLEIQKDRAAVYRYKAEHPDHKFVEDEDGELMALDPAKGTMSYVLNDNGVPVKSLKNLDAAEKQRLDIKGRKEVAEIQGRNAIAAAKERGSQAIALEKEKQIGRMEVKENKDASGKVVSKTTTVFDTEGNVIGTKTENTTTAPVKPSGPKKEVVVPPNVSKVKMTAPDGRVIMVPMDKVAEAEQRGAKRAQ